MALSSTQVLYCGVKNIYIYIIIFLIVKPQNVEHVDLLLSDFSHFSWLLSTAGIDSRLNDIKMKGFSVQGILGTGFCHVSDSK